MNVVQPQATGRRHSHWRAMAFARYITVAVLLANAHRKGELLFEGSDIHDVDIING